MTDCRRRWWIHSPLDTASRMGYAGVVLTGSLAESGVWGSGFPPPVDTTSRQGSSLAVKEGDIQGPLEHTHTYYYAIAIIGGNTLTWQRKRLHLS